MFDGPQFCSSRRESCASPLWFCSGSFGPVEFAPGAVQPESRARPTNNDQAFFSGTLLLLETQGRSLIYKKAVAETWHR